MIWMGSVATTRRNSGERSEGLKHDEGGALDVVLRLGLMSRLRPGL